MDTGLEQAMRWIESVALAAMQNLSALFAPGSRFFAPYIIAALVIAVIARRMHGAGPQTRNVFAAMFGRNIIFHPSSIVDVKLVLANRVFAPTLALISHASLVASAQFVAVTLSGDADTSEATLHGAELLALTICIVVVNDFTTYWVHRLHHESPIFWPFHKVHHSAEVMTPLTFARKHPIYDLIRGLGNFAVVGPAQGLVLAIFGVTDIVTILGVNAVYAVFHWTGSNLRHSHIWLSYGPFWSRVFISPAQHQIHHSCAVRHHDKNYGEVFAIWDWMFGTLYVPAHVEQLEYGVADAQGEKISQPHPTLAAAWIGPLRESASVLVAQPTKKTGGVSAAH